MILSLEPIAIKGNATPSAHRGPHRKSFLRCLLFKVCCHQIAHFLLRSPVRYLGQALSSRFIDEDPEGWQ